MPKLVVTIKKDGTTDIQAEEFVGGACETAVNELIDAMGAEAEGSPEFAPEYYEAEQTGEEELG